MSLSMTNAQYEAKNNGPRWCCKKCNYSNMYGEEKCIKCYPYKDFTFGFLRRCVNCGVNRHASKFRKNTKAPLNKDCLECRLEKLNEKGGLI